MLYFCYLKSKKSNFTKKIMYQSIIKPTFDLLSAFIGLILITPIFILVMILLSIANRENPFFFQLRPGKNRKVFKNISN